MDNVKKDPYLSELDEMDNLEPPPQEETMEDVPQEGEDPTRVDLEAPPADTDFIEEPPPESDASEENLMGEVPGDVSVKEVLDLAPDISVPFVVVMGRKSMTVKDLLSLRMGQIMEMDRAPLEPMELVAAGKVIGKGELVEVDGRLGVRILKLFK
jgi:flagellar motor switch protein FliN